MASARPSLRVSVSGEPGMPVNGQGTAWVFSGQLGCRDLHRSPDRLSRRCFATDGPPDGLFVKKDSVTFQLGWTWAIRAERVPGRRPVSPRDRSPRRGFQGVHRAMTGRYTPNQVVATASTPMSGTSTEVRSGASSRARGRASRTAGSMKRGLELIQLALVVSAMTTTTIV